jgi:hypothetical protein
MRVEARREEQGRPQKFRLVTAASVRKADTPSIVRKFIVAEEASMEKGRAESGAGVPIRLRIFPQRITREIANAGELLMRQEKHKSASVRAGSGMSGEHRI